MSKDGTAFSSHDWSVAEVRAIHDLALPDLLFRAQAVHRRRHPAGDVQLCSLLSIKTGACPEDCAYCAQSSRYQTGVESESLLDREVVLGIARQARANGVSRVCMGAAWREVRDGHSFERVLDLVKEVMAPRPSPW